MSRYFGEVYFHQNIKTLHRTAFLTRQFKRGVVTNIFMVCAWKLFQNYRLYFFIFLNSNHKQYQETYFQ